MVARRNRAPDNMKKPYQIKFGDKTEVLNMPKDKKWVLIS